MPAYNLEFIHADTCQEKKGDLAGVGVYKFKVISRLALLAYEFNDSELLLISIGSHQHFYRIALFPVE